MHLWTNAFVFQSLLNLFPCHSSVPRLVGTNCDPPTYEEYTKAQAPSNSFCPSPYEYPKSLLQALAVCVPYRLCADDDLHRTQYDAEEGEDKQNNREKARKVCTATAFEPIEMQASQMDRRMEI